MYQDFYGLRELPFELTPNTNYLFLSAVQREALSTLQYGLAAAKPITLLIGEAGTGKTTLITAALESERCRAVRCVFLSNPVLTPEDFVRTLAMRFGLTRAAAESKALFLDELERVLRERRSRNESTALVIDEAQSLTAGLLEEIRLLANIETGTEKLLPLVLAGQPEVAVRLENPGLRQLKQRVTLRCALKPFTLPDTAAYMGSRITRAGGIPSKLFTSDAVRLIHEYSQGIARTVNVICDNALVSGLALRRQPVGHQIVLEVCRDLSLRTAGQTAAAPQLDAADEPAADQEFQRPGGPRHTPGRAHGAAALPGPRRFSFRSWFRRQGDTDMSEAVNE